MFRLHGVTRLCYMRREILKILIDKHFKIKAIERLPESDLESTK